VRRVADDDDVSCWDHGKTALARAGERERDECIAIGGIVTKGATAEVTPEIEVFQLDPRAFFEVPRQQAQEHIITTAEGVEQVAHARHHVFHTLSRLQNLFAQVAQIRVAEPREQILVELVADPAERVVKDDPVGTAGDGDPVEGIGVPEDFVTCAVHRSDAGTAGQDERAVDVEKHEFSHGVKTIYNPAKEDS
jgi:hypothetical protein